MLVAATPHDERHPTMTSSLGQESTCIEVLPARVADRGVKERKRARASTVTTAARAPRSVRLTGAVRPAALGSIGGGEHGKTVGSCIISPVIRERSQSDALSRGVASAVKRGR
jgi:hypothetical protein